MMSEAPCLPSHRRVAHLTSAHGRLDVRVFYKECVSLKQAGYDVSLVVADDLPGEIRDGIRIESVGKDRSRLGRMLLAPWRILREALRLKADIYHLHDPELLPIGPSLKMRGYRVVFDAHEDIPKQLLAKHYLPGLVGRVASACFRLYERRVLPRLDLVVAATGAIENKIEKFCSSTALVRNYPVANELAAGTPYMSRPQQVCYVGSISEKRGANQLVDAMALTKEGLRLVLVGDLRPPKLRIELLRRPGWSRVVERGHVGRSEVRDVLSQSRAGIVCFLPAPNHIYAEPNKLFEYMSAGIPVVASHFELWRAVIDEAQCGICLDPSDPSAIASAIQWIVDHPKEAEAMGARGRSAVERLYGWTAQANALLGAYGKL